MPARAFIAALVTLGLLAGGAYFTLDYKQVEINDVVALLMRENYDAGLLCTIAAWGAVAAAALAVLSAFAAFFEEDDEDELGRRRGFPKVIPLILIIVSLVLFWAMFDCAARQAPAPATVISEPAPAPPPQPAPAQDDTPPAAPAIKVNPAAYDWPFMIPLIDDGGYRDTPQFRRAAAALFPAGDDAQWRSALCEAAWVMVSGAASEEGPRLRNETRSRIRAQIAADALRRRIETYTDNCRAPVVLAVDLGQHVVTSPPVAGDGSDTAFQRAVIVATRMRRSPSETMTTGEAKREAEAYLDDPANQAEFFAGRRYGKAPAVFLPDIGPMLN